MRTEVLLGKLKSYSQSVPECVRPIKRRAVDIREVAADLRRFEDDALSEVSAKLLKQCDNLERTAAKMQTFSDTLIRILSLYEDCEEDVLDLLEDGQRSFRARKNISLNSLSDYGNLLKDMDLHFKL